MEIYVVCYWCGEVMEIVEEEQFERTDYRTLKVIPSCSCNEKVPDA